MLTLHFCWPTEKAEQPQKISLTIQRFAHYNDGITDTIRRSICLPLAPFLPPHFSRYYCSVVKKQKRHLPRSSVDQPNLSPPLKARCRRQMQKFLERRQAPRPAAAMPAPRRKPVQRNYRRSRSHHRCRYQGRRMITLRQPCPAKKSKCAILSGLPRCGLLEYAEKADKSRTDNVRK